MNDDHEVDESERNVLFVDLNELISDYLSWAFRTSYLKLLVNFSVVYFLFIVVFAAIYFAVSKQWPMCINSNGVKIGDVERMFGDCFQLSWTTFSTVVSFFLRDGAFRWVVSGVIALVGGRVNHGAHDGSSVSLRG